MCSTRGRPTSVSVRWWPAAASCRTWSTRWRRNSQRTGLSCRGRLLMAEHDLEGELDTFLAGHDAELIDFRRDLHAHPETGYHEYRTTRRVALRLEAAGLRPSVLPKGTGLMVDIGSGADGP